MASGHLESGSGPGISQWALFWLLGWGSHFQSLWVCQGSGLGQLAFAATQSVAVWAVFPQDVYILAC